MNDSAADEVTIRVNAGPNDVPTAEAGPDQDVAEGDEVTLDGSRSSDPENQTLIYRWEQVSDTPTVTLSDTNAVSPTFAVPQLLTDAVLIFSLTVNDGVNDSVADEVTIRVTAVNDPPTANAGPDRSVVAGEAIQLNGSGIDPENQTLSYTWLQESGESGSFDNAAIAAPAFTAATEMGTVVLELTVTDVGGATHSDRVTITVEEDLQPEFENDQMVDDLIFVLRDSVSLTLSEATGGNGSITYSLSSGALPAGLTFSAGVRTIEDAPTVVAAATEITYRAEDEDGDAIEQTFTITVIPPRLGIPSLDDDSNSGSNTDNVTNDDTPSITVDGAETMATVTVTAVRGTLVIPVEVESMGGSVTGTLPELSLMGTGASQLCKR